MKPKLQNERHCTQNMPLHCREELYECYYSLRRIASSPSSLIPPRLSLLPLLSVLKAIRTDFKLMIWFQCDNSSCTQLPFESSVWVTQKQDRVSDALHSLFSVLPLTPCFFLRDVTAGFPLPLCPLTQTLRGFVSFFIAFPCSVWYFSVCHIFPMISTYLRPQSYQVFSRVSEMVQWVKVLHHVSLTI